MKYLILLGLLIGCDNSTLLYEGKCFQPFIHSGRMVKVIKCSDIKIGSNYCVIHEEFLGNIISDTIYVSSLEKSIEVKCVGILSNVE